MRTLVRLLCAGGLWLAASSTVTAQPPGGRGDSPAAGRDAFVARMMAFDKNKDGKLTKDEVTDPRLHRLFDQADADKDGVVTREELTALYDKQSAEGRGRGGFGGPGGLGGFGPPGGGRGPGGFGGPPQPGQVLPSFLQEQLRLTAEQKEKVAALQKEVDEKLEKILTAEQKSQLKAMRERGPRGFGPPGGGPPSGGRPGEGGPPPGRPGEDGPPPGGRPGDRPEH